MQSRTLCESCCCLLPSPYVKPKLAQFAVKCCVECKCYLCSDCASVHPAAHSLADLPEEKTCCFHSGKPLSSFCVTHGVPCCPECVQDEKHRSCQIASIRSGEEKRSDGVVKACERAEKALETIQQAHEGVVQRKDELQQRIREFFSFVKDEVSRREVQMLTDVERCWSEKYDYTDLMLQATERIDAAREASASGSLCEPQEEARTEMCVQMLRDICEKASQVEKRTFELEFSANSEEVKSSIGTLARVGYRCGFKPCPEGTMANKRYAVSGRRGEIATKVEVNGCWSAAIGDTVIPRTGGAVKWAFRPVNIEDGLFMAGVAPVNINLNEDLPHMSCGWYFYCSEAMLYSNPYAHSRSKKYKRWKDAVKVSKEIGVIVDVENRTISFVVANECLGPSYVDVSIDRPLVPAVCLYRLNDSVELLTMI